MVMLYLSENISGLEAVLSEETWTELMQNHEESLSGVLDPYLKKRSMQMKNPVLDFLFEYYAFRPSQLKRWSPGLGVILENKNDSTLPEISELKIAEDHAFLYPKLFPEKKLSSLKWIHSLLEKTSKNKPFFGCFGMHEWAMVYKADDVRHDQIPLRLSHDEIAEFVESRPLLCTHFDAYRFFTKPARPLNKHKLSRETFDEMEQPGCLHTNMDLYKWAFKLYPWISSEVLREAFFNAVETRKVDMQASPYDPTEFGLEPIKIETEPGRKEYLERQTEIFERSIPIRKKVIEEYQKVIEVVGN